MTANSRKADWLLRSRVTTLVLAFLGLVVWYATPIIRGQVDLLEPAYHPEYYRQYGLVFTGYLYPSLLLALLASALLPTILPMRRLTPACTLALTMTSAVATLLLMIMRLRTCPGASGRRRT